MENKYIYDLIINTLPVGFTMVSSDGIITEFNSFAENITGYCKDEVMGKSHFEVFHGICNHQSCSLPEVEVCPLFKYALQKIEQKEAVETTIRRKNNEIIVISVITSPLFDDDGGFIGGIKIFWDITETKKLERERKNLLSMFAHDMKNPVVTAVGFLQRLISGKEGSLNEKQQEYLELVMVELKHLEWFISDFLQYSKFDTVNIKPSLDPFDLKEAILHHIETASVEADKKTITIRASYPEKGMPVIKADSILIGRVITNLLDNAIKYTPPGGLVTISLLERDDDLLVEIKDTGVGIPEIHLPYIFDAFYRGIRDSKGSGLGLSIARTILEAHGGKIWVESVPQKGSTFSFTLPKTLTNDENQ